MRTTIFSLLALGFLFSGCTQEKSCQPPEAILESEVQACSTSEVEIADEYVDIVTKQEPVRIIVVGQGVAPCNSTCSPEQALVLAKRAATVDGYRLIAEKVKGVYVQGRDYVHNMMVKSSKVRTYVDANIRNANIVDTIYKDGLCEVEMEITLNYSQLVY
ncbi:MAG: LPP20 family lipoprotein [Campylobacterota bacterium]|nr:LPP20 family lipoprotein [Campylobacterota bacterium]